MKNIESNLKEKRIFHPSKKFIDQANLNNENLKELINKFESDPELCWKDLAATEITWIKDFTTVCTGKSPFFKWFEDGTLNVSENCLDRHVQTNKKDKIAIKHVSEDNNITNLTYEDLFLKVNAFSSGLKKLGLKKQDRVIIYMPTIPESITAMLSCARLGLIHSVVFAGFSSESLKDRINDCSAKAVITVDSFKRGGKSIRAKDTVDDALDKGCPSINHCIVFKNSSEKINFDKTRDVWWHEIVDKKNGEVIDPVEMNAEDLLFILYTSGSTGKPKGIIHSTAGYLLNCILTNKWVFDLKDDDIFWCTADIGWITGHSYVVYGPLATGSTILIYDGAPTYPEGDRFWKIVDENKVSIFYTAPTAIRTLMKLGDELPKRNKLNSLRLLGTVGEPINPEAWIWYYKIIGKEKCPIVDTWWQTETGANMIAPLPGIYSITPGTCTKPLPGIDIGVMDANGNEVKNNNQGGNLVIKKPWPSMLRGIWGDEDRYISTYWEKYNNKFYITGDTARRDEDGNIWIMGRSDDVVNISGHRLGTMEIESAIVSHEFVAESAVVSYSHDIKGEAIHSFVVLRNNFKSQIGKQFADELREWVKMKIGSIAKPDRISFATNLPKTRSGKIMRRLLRNIARGEKISGDTSTLENENILNQLKDVF
ncbi:MAG: acetate--CoA ligase [Pseudomonadota bacterium]|nr:acetate--CoA ligase [Pseudomonadota bacterium]|tara:strand:+ start:3154 stop:5112 length:1959 start_codon:yes stop_codon:yes gene_type:complete